MYHCWVILLHNTQYENQFKGHTLQSYVSAFYKTLLDWNFNKRVKLSTHFVKLFSLSLKDNQQLWQ